MSVLFSGCKGAGKTYAALHQWAAERIGATGYSLLVVDPRRVETLAHLYHASNRNEAISRVIVTGEPTAYTPRSEDDFDRLVKKVDAAGELVFLIDEVRYYVGARHVSKPLVDLARVERNAKVELAFTTQSYGDVGRELTCNVDEFVLFRHIAQQDLDAIAAKFGKETAAEVAVLPEYKPIRKKVGF